MSRLPKSKLPAVSTPISPVELVQKIKSLSQGDPRALAASSTAIALSIASPFYDTRETSSDDIPTRGRDNGWQTAYAAARMAVEIAKESSDMFLPLKAVVGAMSALIKNYDVSMFLWQPGCLLIPRLLPITANIRECGDGEGGRTEGSDTFWRAYLPHKRR